MNVLKKTRHTRFDFDKLHFRNEPAICAVSPFFFFFHSHLSMTALTELLHADPWNPPIYGWGGGGGAYSMDGDPIHGSLHILVDPVTRLVEENRQVGVSGVGSKAWGERGQGGLLRGMK